MFAQVILSISHTDVDRIYDYEIPLELIGQVQLGSRVQVPFGARNGRVEGFVVGLREESEVPADRVKYITRTMDRFPVFGEQEIELAWWLKEKYYATLTQCLQVIKPSGLDLKNEERVLYLLKSGEELRAVKEKMKLQESRFQQLIVIELIENYGEQTAAMIQRALHISPSPIKTLIKNGILAEKTLVKRKELVQPEEEPTPPLVFNEEQRKAYEGIFNSPGKPVLIHGITGSGKTEIYLQAIDRAVNMGKSAIVLVPEISLTPQLFSRFRSRFGQKVLLTHSRMSQGERLEVWHRVKKGEVSVVIGPRSAVFMPFENLGIIVVDEEHEGSYKSDTTPKYDAREVAEFRCKQQGAVLVFGSATPSLKTYHRAKGGEVVLFSLNDRALGGAMPKIQVVDMRQELAEGNTSIFSRDLYFSIKDALARREQVMLFINRRGFSTFVSCRKCGEVMTCDRCNVSYTYHHGQGGQSHLMCHYCGAKKEVPKTCPSCGSKYIKYFGAGTQRVEQEIRRHFPSAKVLRMDMDTTTKKSSHAQILNAFNGGGGDILIGTQMIAKGHDFHRVTLVGVIAADMSLNMGDYRSGEISYQLLTQVAGRAGRGALAGKVVLQTYAPDHYIIQLVKNGTYEEFYEKESGIRQLMAYPPYTHIFSILMLGKDEKGVIDYIHQLKDILERDNDGFEILGPSPAVISKIKDEYRWRILVKGDGEEKLRSFVTGSVSRLKERRKANGILINLSLDPQNIV